jgi:hypothetical protein
VLRESCCLFPDCRSEYELAKALRSQYDHNVEVVSVSVNHAQFRVQILATRKVSNGDTILNTPSLLFQHAQKVLKNYWFAPDIKPDFSPEVHQITIPDRICEKFYDQDQIPSIMLLRLRPDM